MTCEFGKLPGALRVAGAESDISKGIGRQGICSFVRKSSV